MRRSVLALAAGWTLLVATLPSPALSQPPGPPLAGTELLEWDGDIASRMVDGLDRFLLNQTDQAAARRLPLWQDPSPDALAAHRARLAHILGIRDQRVPFQAPELLATTDQPALVGRGTGYEILAVRWPAFGDVHGEGLLLEPVDREPIACVVALPDADQPPEMLCGLVDGTPAKAQFARRLAESGCRVLVPVLIDRRLEPRGGRASLTSREYLYRPAYELGRHVLGYELQKVLAGLDWFERDRPDTPIGVIGWGEGGLLALYSAALDQRIDAACVSGSFGTLGETWQQPIDRNVFGLLERFGDAELARLVAPRPLIIEAARGPERTLPSDGGAPGRLLTPTLAQIEQELARLDAFAPDASPVLIKSASGNGPPGSTEALRALLAALAPEAPLADDQGPPRALRDAFDPDPRQARQQHELDRHNQELLVESPYVRAEFMKDLDTSTPEAYARTSAGYRRIFRDEIIGRFDEPVLPPRPRTRVAYDQPAWIGYDVVLDVFPNVFAYGVLLVPQDVEEGERRPVVVCQHGLEGRPQDTIAGDHRAYHDFAARLAERGFVVFAPQNPYLFKDRFRTLQRKANPLGKTLFSLIVPQHQQIVDWLQSLDFVDPDRIGFYGLSYGGKTAMRVPALVEDYALSICSADFNDWIWKNASTRSRYSYVWTGEYEMFDFDLGSTFNYAEMAALIAPRPFMVERGHADGVAPDETVAYEFAKVRHLYEARLGLEGRARIEWFNGPHTINGKGTFAFLHEFLDWPEAK